MTQVGTWSRWIGGGALALALAGLLVPATTSAMIYQDDTPEVIEVEGEAPWNPSMGMGGHNGAGAPNGTPSGDSGGGSGGGGVPSGGGGVPSGGDPMGSAAQQRLAAAKQDCLVLEGVWGPAVFKDIVTNIAYAGYSCRYKLLNGKYEWHYFDSEGYLNQRCVGDLDVQTCEEP
jgi:hypothetical protein